MPTILTLLTIKGTPIKAKPAVLGNAFALWAALTWLSGRKRPDLPWPTRLGVGALATATLLLADVGHAIAHISSARRAGAPMDEILISAEMPRTLYVNNAVPPAVHRRRAIGGPIFSALGLCLSWLLRALAPPQSLLRELAEWSSRGHGLILAGSLAPLPMVDGGTILKWTLVEQGQTPAKADQVVKYVGVATGVAAVASGVILATRRRWLPALGLTTAGIVALGAAVGKIR
jgi:hypothetical protein